MRVYSSLLFVLTLVAAMKNQLIFDDDDASGEGFVIATSKHATPLLISSRESEALHVALKTFAEDVERVTGVKPKIHHDSLPKDTRSAIVVSTSPSSSPPPPSGAQQAFSAQDGLAGQWESFKIGVKSGKDVGADSILAVTGSDKVSPPVNTADRKRGAIYALYTLSEHMGVSPWYWWADVPVTTHKSISFPSSAEYFHGPPAVKYRGLFLNDEQPVLWNWAREHFKMGQKPPFQVGMYERFFELLLRLKANYAWPAMWASMFAVDGMDLPGGRLSEDPTPGPNQALADKMGIVMGTSHHEPMSRNQKEWTTWGEGPWNFVDNEKTLTDFWRYGAERAKGLETVFTVGMRGDGDLPLDGANIGILENITAVQQQLLKDTYGDIKDIPQMWAMYKEVMGYYANGLKVPDEVTALLADDNWGNLVAVLPDDRRKPKAGGIYYHADYVGDPRDYKWINTVPLAKMWEQLNVALSFDMNEIWILNVGDLKFLETPLEFFLSIAYDGRETRREGMLGWVTKTAERDFGAEHAGEIAEILALYSIYASRRKAELLDSDTFSLVNFNESDRVLKEWQDLEVRAAKVYNSLGSRKTAFYEMVYVQVQLQTNLNRLYSSAAKSNLYATQGRTAANRYAEDALACFERDEELTQEFNKVENGKWNHMLCQTHIGYQYWQMPVRNSMAPTSRISKHTAAYAKGDHVNVRFTVENCLGAWPGDHRFNCALGYDCPDPTLLPMDQFGQPRWVDVGSGGPGDVNFTATPEFDWVRVEPSSGLIKGDGSTDTRVYISIDWTKAAGDLAHVQFNSSDGAHMIVTLPLVHLDPPSDFRGAVQGDGYICLEASHHTNTTSSTHNGTEYMWEVIPFYGRTHSGMSVYPVENYHLPPDARPCIRYDFWSTHTGDVDLIFHIGPTNNYVLGSKLAFAVQVDEGEVQEVEPIPEAPLGELSADWEDIVANEIREVKMGVKLEKEGSHTLRVFGITSGIVLERVILDMGGIKARGYSYLGPTESVIL